MILDGLPLELMREVLLDLHTVDIIRTVKCTRRLYQFAKADKALSRRLQYRVLDVHLCLDETVYTKYDNPVLRLYLDAKFRRANDERTRWSSSRFDFCFEGDCRSTHRNDQTPKIESGLLDRPSFFYDRHFLRICEDGTKFDINNGSLDDAAINCAKLLNILMKFCVIHKLIMDLGNDHMWDKMNAFFNANPPNLRIQPCVSIPPKINLDDFLMGSIFSNGLAEISIGNEFQSTFADAYHHEVFRRIPSVSFYTMDLPYTYEDVFGFFKDTKKLSFHSETRIPEEQICQIVQNFYEVKQNERILEIQFDEDFLVKDFLTLIPKKAYRLHLVRSGIVGPEPETRTWAKMTDKFGGRWALVVIIVDDCWRFLHICSMKCFTEDYLFNLCDDLSCEQFNSDQFDSDQSGFDQPDSDFDLSDSDSDPSDSDFDPSDSDSDPSDSVPDTSDSD